jgi:hypothetical protein
MVRGCGDLGASAPPPLRPPWARPGWLDEATAWIHARLGERGLAATGPIVQVKVWSISCLLRVPTSGNILYFKAVPPLFAQESRITEALGRRYPGHAPRGPYSGGSTRLDADARVRRP